MRKAVLVVGIGIAVATAGPAQAKWRIDVGAAISGISSWATNFITAQSAQFFTTFFDNAAKVGTAIQAEQNKAAIAQKQVSEAIASYEVEESLRVRAEQAVEDARQPAVMCQNVSASNSLTDAESNAAISAFRASMSTTSGSPSKRPNLDGTDSAAVFESAAYVSDIHRRILAQSAYTAANFCTEADAKRGRCSVNKEHPELAGADMSAAYLYQGTDNSNTYTLKQEIAVDAFIDRIAAGAPAELLRDPEWEKTPQGKAYVELSRRYAAFQSMSAYSLHQIKATRMAQN